MRYLISILGDREVERGSQKWILALNLSRSLVDNGYRIITGGVGTLSKATYKGAQSSSKYTDSSVIAILPGFGPQMAAETSDIQIATGLDEYRNIINANSDAVIAIGGGAGTLSEIALAWSLKRLIICMKVDGWSGELAGRRIDKRVRYPNVSEDKCYPAENEREVIDLLYRYLPIYQKRHHGIPRS